MSPPPPTGLGVAVGTFVGASVGVAVDAGGGVDATVAVRIAIAVGEAVGVLVGVGAKALSGVTYGAIGVTVARWVLCRHAVNRQTARIASSSRRRLAI
jgi:hypothetical protein